MFKVGELVIYGNVGVCKVECVGQSTLKGADPAKDYYFLKPYFTGNGIVMIPCDSDRVVLRHVISMADANDLIEDISNVAIIEIKEEKFREQVYKDIIRRCDCRDLLGLLKTIYARKQARIAEGKKVTSNDERYFNLAEEKLYGELAVAMGENKAKVKEMVKEKISQNYLISIV